MSPTDDNRQFVRTVTGEEEWELVEGEQFELLDKDEIDEDYWEQGGYWEGPPDEKMLQDATGGFVRKKKWYHVAWSRTGAFRRSAAVSCSLLP